MIFIEKPIRKLILSLWRTARATYQIQPISKLITSYQKGKMENQSTLAIFDFDGTLTTKDSFWELSKLCSTSIITTIVLYILGIGYKLGFLSDGPIKSYLFKNIWKKKSLNEKQRIADELNLKIESFENASVLSKLKSHLSQNHKVVIISGAANFYMSPYVKNWDDRIEVFGSDVDFDSGNISFNLQGPDKGDYAKRLKEEFHPTKIFVYGDSHHDLPMLMQGTDLFSVNASPKLEKALKKLGLNYVEI